MNIAVVNSFFPPWRGGAETYAYNLSKALARRRHNVTVLCGSDPLPPGTGNQDGIRIRRLRILGRLYGTPIMPGLAMELYHLDVDIFHANFPSPYIAFNVALASGCKSVPAVLTWHNDLPPVTAGARFLIEAHDRFVLPNYLRPYRRIISTSQTYAKRSRILKSLHGLVTVVPNGVDCERYNPKVSGKEIRKSLSLGQKFTFLFVGALTKWHGYKGLDVLMEALRITGKTCPDMRLIVVGDGDLKESYRALCVRYGLSRMMIFAGNIPDDKLAQYYAAADALVLPSKDMSEGFGLTLLEANATGKPVVASTVGGIPSVVKDGYNGLLVQPNDPKQLAQALLKLEKDRAWTRVLGRNGRIFAESHDWSTTAAQTEEIYKEILSNRS